MDCAELVTTNAKESRLVIVHDRWLTGFDAPCLHTMYADKPMRGPGLMQAIARLNRVFRDKQSRLIVDYPGLADQLKQAAGQNEGILEQPPTRTGLTRRCVEAYSNSTLRSGVTAR